MGQNHVFPSDTKDCMVSMDQKCKFFLDTQKSEKSVFIAAPVRVSWLIEATKDVVKEYGFEPLLATEVREYNQNAFCHNICRRMLESWITIVIGDWKKNKGNANVAFEYGIATALGCEIVPVNLDNKKGTPFDISGFHSIIVRKGDDGEWDLNSFRKEFRECFEKSKSKMELRKQETMLSESQKARLNELMRQFTIARTSKDRRTAMALIKKFSNTHSIHRDYEFVQRMADFSHEYAALFVNHQPLGGNLKVECIDESFFKVLGDAISPNLRNPACAVISDNRFHGALAVLARGQKVPIYARTTAIHLLLQLAAHLGDGKLLCPVFDVIEDTQLSDTDYRTMAIPHRLAGYADLVMVREESLSPLLERISIARSKEDAMVQGRIEEIDDTLRN